MRLLQILASDSYKQFHYKMYPKGITKLYSNMTPRGSRLKSDKAVWFGLQYYIKEYLMKKWYTEFFNVPLKSVLAEYKRFHKYFSGVDDIETDHIEQLWKLQYLPIKIKSLPEGTLVNMKVPFYTITNTHEDFAWLVNFLETPMSTVIWDLTTNATVALQYRMLLDKYALLSVGNTDGVAFQAHDFSMRGRSSMESSYNQAGHLLSFRGTDVIPAVIFLEEYYNANMEKELIGASVPATEHSVMTSYGKENEIDAFRRLFDLFPTGILSIVSDSFDLWKVCTEFMPTLKEEIMVRDGKIVLRPDSGDPVTILCGIPIEEIKVSDWVTDIEKAKRCMKDAISEIVREDTPHGENGVSEYTDIFKYDGKYYEMTVDFMWNRYDKQYYFIDGETISDFKEVELTPAQIGVVELLWNTFGGATNDKGFKELDSHIGVIYGDSITLERAQSICTRLMAKGFASTNVVMGIGSYTYNYNTRDTLGIAVKSTYCEVKYDGVIEHREIFKDPITDDGLKKSDKGLLNVERHHVLNQINNRIETENFVLVDQVSAAEEEQGELKEVFRDNYLIIDQSLSEIRARLERGIKIENKLC